MLGGLMTENDNDNGISNLTAAMLLKGTAARKENQITGAIEARGGSITTFSSFNSFGINLELLKPDIGEGVAILKDILTNSTFPQDEIDRLKSQIAAGIKDEDDDIFHVGSNALKKELFAGSPYAFRPLGTFESLGSITRRQIMDYYKRYCVPNNMIISIAGDIAADDALGKIKDAFDGLKAGKAIPRPETPKMPDSVKERSVEMDREESLVLFGFRAVGAIDPDRYPLEVLSAALSGQSGRMFRALRNKESLAYTLGCFQKNALDAGFVGFYVATVKGEIDAAKAGIIDQIRDLKEKDIGDEELTATKKELISVRMLEMQSNSFYSFTGALDELYGLGYDDLYKYDARIEKVTKEDVKRVAVKYFNMNACAEIIISSKK
jgi:zinc protease